MRCRRTDGSTSSIVATKAKGIVPTPLRPNTPTCKILPRPDHGASWKRMARISRAASRLGSQQPALHSDCKVYTNQKVFDVRRNRDAVSRAIRRQPRRMVERRVWDIHGDVKVRIVSGRIRQLKVNLVVVLGVGRHADLEIFISVYLY